jgi:hypothetical protein
LAAAHWDSPNAPSPVSTGISAASVCRHITRHITDFGYIVKAVSKMVSLPRLMTARVSVMWWMRHSLMDGQALDNVHGASPATSSANTQAADVPEAQDPPAG